MSDKKIFIPKTQMYVHIGTELGVLLMIPWFYKLSQTEMMSQKNKNMIFFFIICTILVDGGLLVWWLKHLYLF